MPRPVVSSSPASLSRALVAVTALAAMQCGSVAIRPPVLVHPEGHASARLGRTTLVRRVTRSATRRVTARRLIARLASACKHGGVTSDFDPLVRELEDGPAYRFSDWRATRIEAGPSGVYTIWNGDAFLYVGMAWRHRDEQSPSASGVFGRLASHASGRRSGNQFCIYICDRFVVPELSVDDVTALRRGQRLLDQRTRTFIHEHLTYRVVMTSSGEDARLLEAHVRRAGLARSGRPEINP